MSDAPLYFDHNATSPLAAGVFEAMRPYLQEAYHNPSSASETARPVRVAIEEARRATAALLGAKRSDQVRFTSGGTESIHAAFFSACHGGPHGNRRRIGIGGAEHSATQGAAQRWSEAGYRVSTLPVDGRGCLALGDLQSFLDEGDVAFVSILAANNETGAQQDLTGFAEAIVAAGARWHVDAVQMPGKSPIPEGAWGAHWLSISGHKFGAPKGIGALYSADSDQQPCWLAGGGQEHQQRGGTENVAGIVGLGVAAQQARERAEDGPRRAAWAALRDRLESRLCAAIPGAYVHASGGPRVPNTTFVCLPGLPAEFLLPMIEQGGLLASAGSACDATHWKPSPVLLAMGVDPEHASASLRLSLGPETTQEQVDRAVEILIQAHAWLRPGEAS